MKNKKVIIPLVTVLLVIVVFFIFNQPKKESLTIKENTVTPEDGDGDGVAVPVIIIDEERKISIEEEFPSAMPEHAVQSAIHGMSHQKVHAEDKWGFLPMTQERIERLIVVVEANKKSYNNPETYLKILNRWSKSDFSHADFDHNLIWDLQDGTVGRAYGTLSIEEERDFIKKHFNIEIKEVTSE